MSQNRELNWQLIEFESDKRVKTNRICFVHSNMLKFID